jgi:hypothetical protein
MSSSPRFVVFDITRSSATYLYAVFHITRSVSNLYVVLFFSKFRNIIMHLDI